MAPDPGFPPAHRVLKGGDFGRVLRGGRRAADAVLSVTAAPNGLPHPRLGLAVSGRWGGAVRRNRMKRLVREAFRLRRGEIPPGFDYVVSPRATEPPRFQAVAASLVVLASTTAKATR